MLVNISPFRSESATKKQQENFNTAFGFKPADGTRILKTLEALSKEKVVNTQHLDTILGFLKSADAATAEAYSRKAVAKSNAVVFKALDKAKTLQVVVNNLKKIKSTGIVVSAKPSSGSGSGASGSSAGLFSMIVPVTQDGASDVAFPPKSWYSKTGVKVEAFEPGEIDYDSYDPLMQTRNFLFSGTKQQLEAFKLVMAEDDPDEDYGPHVITKFKMPKGYIPADQAKEYARKNGVKIKGLAGSDRKPVSSTTTGSDGDLNSSVLGVVKLIESFDNAYDDATDGQKAQINKKLKAFGVDVAKLYRNGRLTEITARNDARVKCLTFHVSSDGDSVDYVVNYDLKSGSVFAEKDTGTVDMYYQGGPRRVIRGTEVKVKTAAEFGKAVTSLITNKRLVSTSNDPDVNTKVLEVVKLLKNLGGYGEAVDEGNPAVSAINKKLKALGVNVDSPSLKGRLVEIAYRLDSRAKCLAFHVSSDGGDSVSHIVNYDLNTGTVFAEKDLDDGKMFHQGGPRRVIPGSESAVRTVSEFGAAVSAKIGSKLFS